MSEDASPFVFTVLWTLEFLNKMCLVHLIPSVDELRFAVSEFDCYECDSVVSIGAAYRHIEGELDDGSGNRYLYCAHDNCYQWSVLDTVDGECFIYGGAHPIGPKGIEK